VINSILNFFISPAFAEGGLGAGPAAPSAASSFSLPLMLAVFVGFVYFTVWRPQNKRAKEQRAMFNALAKGDEIVTAGGLVGKVSRISQSYIVLALTDGVEVTLQKSAVTSVLPKGTMKSV
jgi:preprotein translocase subunit YajC